jgi:hypothetical protein
MASKQPSFQNAEVGQLVKLNRLAQSPQPTAGLTRIAAAMGVANPISQLGSSGSDARVFGRVERPLAPRPSPPHQFARGHHLAVQGDEGFPDAIAHPAAPDPFHRYTSPPGGLFLVGEDIKPSITCLQRGADRRGSLTADWFLSWGLMRSRHQTSFCNRSRPMPSGGPAVRRCARADTP